VEAVWGVDADLDAAPVGVEPGSEESGSGESGGGELAEIAAGDHAEMITAISYQLSAISYRLGRRWVDLIAESLRTRRKTRREDKRSCTRFGDSGSGESEC
jgi:hypothetical protein